MKKSVLTLALVAVLGGFGVSPLLAGDIDPAKVPEKKVSTLGLYLSAKEAYEMKKAGGDKVLFIDVRTPEEVQYVGNLGDMMDANIPYQLNDISAYDAKKKVYANSLNSNFTVAVEELADKKSMGKDGTIILTCRSGDRSAVSANLLAKAGYTKVYSVVDGFEGDMSKDGRRSVNGWKNANLPWSYGMNKDTMYYVLN
ncbi:MAG: rhodanese-like domain-containing protein [Halothiobacillaceae bacterium]|nr:rhodanese-like domain-containing protein [Halothiobacillaceae bacterium]